MQGTWCVNTGVFSIGTRSAYRLSLQWIQHLPNGDVRNNNPSFQPETRKKVLDILEDWKKYLEKYECSYSNLVIALTSQMMDGLHILGGARKPEQVEDNAKALGVSLEEADIVQMKKI